MEYTPDDFKAVLDMIASGRLDVRPWIGQQVCLADVGKAFDDLSARTIDNIKVIINPAL